MYLQPTTSQTKGLLGEKRELLYLGLFKQSLEDFLAWIRLNGIKHSDEIENSGLPYY